MKIFTAAFKKHMRKLFPVEKDFNKFYLRILRLMEKTVVRMLEQEPKFSLRDTTFFDAEFINRVCEETGYDNWDFKQFHRVSAGLIRELVEKDLKNKMNKDLELKIKEHFHSCWQDSDCPQAELTFGVKRA